MQYWIIDLYTQVKIKLFLGEHPDKCIQCILNDQKRILATRITNFCSYLLASSGGFTVLF